MASRCLMFMYFLLPHWVPATWRRRGADEHRGGVAIGEGTYDPGASADLAVQRSMTLFVRIRVQCSGGKSQ